MLPKLSSPLCRKLTSAMPLPHHPHHHLGLFFIGKVDYYVVLEKYLYVGPVDKLL